jgi:hypothetical protein
MLIHPPLNRLLPPHLSRQCSSQQPGQIDDEDCLFSIRYRQAMDAATAINGTNVDVGPDDV